MKNKKLIQTAAVFGLLCLFNLTAYAVEPKTDFNGDGKADIFLRNAFTGNLSSWLINGTTFISKPAYGKVLPSSGYTTLGIKDANGDGMSDLYWYNFKTGNVSAWLMNGATVLQKPSYGGLSPQLGWHPYSLVDFNNDGKFGLLWYNSLTGELQKWYINGTTVTRKILWGTLPPANGWFPIGIKDLNGNGLTDLLLYNVYSGAVSAWLDNGLVANYGTLQISNGWSPIGLEDFNGDLKSDLLVYNQKSGALEVWLINGSVLSNIVRWGADNIKDGLGIAGFNDFNGDGRSDILWYNSITGNIKAWITGGGIVNYGTGSPSAGWQPMGLDDFNGDGRADLLWFNAFTNATTTWLLNGKGVLQSANYGSIPASSVWTINIPR